MLRALRESPAVLLIDEIDRADDEFEAFLLEVLSTFQVTIPELGTVAAVHPPVVVLTSNRTREVHDALKRRCLYHWIDHPGSSARSRSSGRGRPRSPRRWPSRSSRWCSSCAPPTWSRRPGSPRRWTGPAPWTGSARSEVDVESAARTLGAAVKHREDADRVRAALDRMLAP